MNSTAHTPTKIVIIHDDMDIDYPLVVMLKHKYSDENVVFFKHSQEGLQYVLKNLGQKMVVLLDKNFKDQNDISGLKVFEEIRKQTSLVYVVLISANSISDFSEEELKTIVNKDLFKLEKFTSDYSSIIKLLDEAVSNINVRVDAAIEDWIVSNNHNIDLPIYFTNTKKYTLADILKEIRLETDLGKDFVRKINDLTIELLMRNKESIS